MKKSRSRVKSRKKRTRAKDRTARGNYFASRSSRTTTKSINNTKSIRTVKKGRQRHREKLKRERKYLKEIAETRKSYIEAVKNITREYRTSNPVGVNILFEKLGSEDLIRKILANIEAINDDLDVRLKTYLKAFQDIDYEDPGLYELDDLIKELDKIIKTVDMDQKIAILDESINMLQEILEQEEQHMNTGHHNPAIVAIIDKML